jgi:voltage-gated potassium channel Kch
MDVLYAVLVIIGLILIGTVFYHLNEALSWVDSAYFTTMTLLTVGYGDFAPRTDVSKIFTMIYSLISIPAILFCLGLIVNDFIKERIDQIEERFDKIIRKTKE